MVAWCSTDALWWSQRWSSVRTDAANAKCARMLAYAALAGKTLARCIEVLARVYRPFCLPFSIKIAAAGVAQWLDIDYYGRKHLTHLWAPACPRSGDRTRPFDKAL